MEQTLWKVFYPKSSWSLPSGVLIGVVNKKQSSVTVASVVQQEFPEEQMLGFIKDLNARIRRIEDKSTVIGEKSFQVVGILVNENEQILKSKHFDDLCLEMEICLLMQSDWRGSPHECVVIRQTKGRHVSIEDNTMFIAYDPSVEYQTKSAHYSIRDSCLKNGKLVNHVMACLHDWNSLNECCDLEQIQIKKLNTSFRDLCYSVWLLIARCSLNLLAWILNIFSHKIFHNFIFDKILCWPATGCQLKEKYNQIKECSMLYKTNRHFNREMNLLLLLVVDLVLGMALVFYFHQVDFFNILASMFLQFVNITAASLEQLLHWLMGAPAGLKLNRELASFLGQFFLYHIYLWVGYLNTIAPFLAVAIKFASLCGCLGVSVVIALASDVLSILTFHVYCFYVYAARIYCLQVHGLMSFWRLFRGKKWNVLRQRVDSSDFRVDQLFIGTLLFTILLFLLPTTAFFYAVFTSLRLAVLIPQSLVASLIVSINTFPLYSLILWTGGFMVDGITFHSMLQNNKCGWLLLKMKPMSLRKVMAADLLDDKQTKYKALWHSVGKDLLTGYLVYPWGGKQEMQ
ncbi:phosphatidylinositol N-acetylglucosaminyltransferase subunit Q-like isoform X1 [Antedon mediterranea]|uniref:phosphatidylinositol N-acetylglucosaminyltransferase subunit Q-like isoform X1 n=1 Tax=Antedon mediterranea TaxID=105859 RepID=UPI003AF421DF